MSGLDCFAAHNPNYVGFDYSALLKGAGGLFSGVAEGFSEKKGGGVDSAEKQRLEQEKRKAEQSASTMKYVLIGVAALVGVGGLVFLLKGRAPAPVGK